MRWRGGRVVYGSSLENWRGRKFTVSSNLTPSAPSLTIPLPPPAPERCGSTNAPSIPDFPGLGWLSELPWLEKYRSSERAAPSKEQLDYVAALRSAAR